MTIIQPSATPARAFGSGGSEPYATALHADDPERLHLRDLDSSRTSSFDIADWCAPANPADLTMLVGVSGPVLDIGCGPGRMVRAALDLGLPALGVDVSAAAVRLARSTGLPVLERSIFDPLPHSDWSTILLADGNIGIGGDPVALLTRCRELMSDDGSVVVEVATDPSTDRRYRAQLSDDAGRHSAEFPWAELGAESLERAAEVAGLATGQSWSTAGRRFSRLMVTSR
ncbi:class I SAM-dependent methyltransferase [soil metagenome]